MLVTPEQSNRNAAPVQAIYASFRLVESSVRWLNLYAHSADPTFKPEHQAVQCDFEYVQGKTPASFFVTLVLVLEDPSRATNRLNFALSTVSEFEYRPENIPAPLPEKTTELHQILADALGIAIGTARGYLAMYLAHTPYSSYVLPAMETGRMFRDKYNPPKLPQVTPPDAPKKRGRKPSGGSKEDGTKED